MCFFGKKKKDKLANELLRGLSDASNNRDKLFNGQKYDQDDYGFSSSNPIMTSTVSSTTRYLNCLRTEDGFPVKWNRWGSLFMKTVHGASDVMVDKYQLTVDDAPADIIYICPYGHQSQHAPKGYQLVEEGMKTAQEIADETAKKQKKALLQYQNVSYSNYGLNETNPIISESIEGAEEYLRRLCTPDGKQFTWSEHTKLKAKVHGWDDVEVIKYPLFLEDQPYAEIFFVPGIGKAEFPPAGLCFSDDKRNWDEERRIAQNATDWGVDRETAIRMMALMAQGR